MKFCIVVNKLKERAAQLADEFVSELKFTGSEYYFYENLLLPGTDFAVVFGGDGTILKFVRSINGDFPPILGINCGHLGFLAEAYRPMKDFLHDIMSNQYTLDSRKMLRISFGDETFFALNEAVLRQSESSNLINVEITIDNVTLDKYRADGVIVATPTGSTAYSLSAGGPVLSPKLPAYIVTPICPHSLQSRPIVLADTEVISITGKSKGGLMLIVDGVKVASAQSEAILKIATDTRKVSFVCMHKHSFYKTMISKFNQEDGITDGK